MAVIPLLLAAAVAVARAEEGGATPPPSSPPPPVVAGPAAPGYATPPGVAVVPGTDAHGRPVPPADLAPADPRLPPGARLRLHVPLAPPAGPRGVLPELEIEVGPPPDGGIP